MITGEGRALNKTVTEGTALMTANTVLQKFLGAATMLLVANGLSVAGFGVLRLVQSGIGAAGSFYFSNVGNIIIAEAGRLRGNREWGALRSLLGQYVRVIVGIGFVLGAGGVAAAVLVGAKKGGDWFSILLFAALLLFLSGAAMAATTVFQVFLRFRSVVTFRIIEQVSYLAGMAALFITHSVSVSGVLAVHATALALALIASVPALRSAVSPLSGAARAPSSLFGIIKSQGTYAVLIEYTKNFTDNGRLWIIGAVLGVEAVGLYSLADSLLGHTVSLFPLSQVLLPVVSGETRDPERMRRVFVRSVKYHFIGFAALSLLGLFAFPPLLVLLFPKYAPAVSLYRWMIAVLVIVAPAPTLTVYLTVLRKQRILWQAFLLRAAVAIPLIFIFARTMGLAGVLLEFAITWIFFTAVRLIGLLRAAPFLRARLRTYFSVDDYDRELLRATLRLPV